MTTDAPRPEDAPQSDVPPVESQSAAPAATEPPASAEPAVPESLQEPESSSAPEPPETPDEPEDTVGETQPSEPSAASEQAPSEQAPSEQASAEPVAAETTPTEAAASETSTPPASAEEPAAAPKIQLQGADDATAIPSSGEAAPAPTNVQVEIPRDDDLDASLEAELDAALAGESTPAPPTPPGQEVVPPEGERELTPGQKVTGTISSIAGDNIIVDLGVRTAGVLPARQFSKQQAEVGQSVEVVVDAINEEEGTAAVSLPGGSRKPAGNWDAVAVGQVVDALVKKTNKGGLEVMVGGLRGFMPASQVDLGFVSDLEQFVGTKVTAKILEVNPQRRKLVVSRRSLLAEERKEKEGALFDQLEKGKTVTGKVKSIKDFGAFVDLGGADGLLHIGQISWSRINHPSDVLEVGQDVEVQILDVDTEKKKISLSMRQLQSNPWSTAEQTYQVGNPVTGTVSRVTDFGAFVKLEPGVEGLIHISQLDHKRVRAVTDVVQEGQEVEAKVLEVDTGRRRISLSLKAMSAAEVEPEMMEHGSKEDDRRRRRKPRGDLRGGTGGGGRGGLFGNPNDFG